MTRNLWVPVVLVAALSGPAAAQAPLSLEQAIDEALARNASLRAARAAASEAGARADEARSAFFPRISFSESWQRGNEPVFVFSSLLSARRFGAENFAIDSLNHPDPLGFFRAGAGIDQLVFDGGRTRATAAISARRREMADAAVQEAAAGVVLITTRTYGRVLAAQSARDAHRAGVDAAREDLARAERRRDAGLATEADVLALVVHVAELEQRLLQADGDIAIASAELNRLMGRPIESAFAAAAVPSALPEEISEDDLTRLFKEAEAARPELRRAAAAEQAAAAGRRLARAAVWPQVSARAAFDVSGTRFDDRASAWVVGAEARWTFSTGGAERSAIAAARHAAERAAAERDDALAAVRVEVVSAARGLAAARARRTAGLAAVEQAREAQRIIRDRFGAGLASVNDVLRASSALLDAEANRVSAVVDVAVSTAMLQRALGRIP